MCYQHAKLLPCYALKSNTEKTRSKLKEDHLMQTTPQLFTALFLQHTGLASGSRVQISQFSHLVLPTSWQIVFTPAKPSDLICMLISCARLGNRRLCRKNVWTNAQFWNSYSCIDHHLKFGKLVGLCRSGLAAFKMWFGWFIGAGFLIGIGGTGASPYVYVNFLLIFAIDGALV